MFKKVIKSLVIGGAALTLATSAVQAADTVDVNIYGASAQFKFWTASAPYFLEDQGCDPSDIYNAINDVEADAGTHDRDTGISVCVGSDGVDTDGDGVADITGSGINGDTLVIRYTTNASYDGIRAVVEDANNADAAACGAANYHLREQADLDGASLVQWGSSHADPGDSITTLSCQDVNIGASDVAASTFAQTSEGLAKAYNTTDGSYIDRTIVWPDFLAEGEDALDDVTEEQSVVVPFNFFGNDGLESDATAPTLPFDNLTRLQAVSIFSGKVKQWSDFDPTLEGTDGDQEVIVCLRHAGSGTAATLNAAVMRGDATVPQAEVADTDLLYTLGLSPQIWFNKGSSDEMKCVGKRTGAVGYADTNKCVDGCNDKYGVVKSLTYQGVLGTSDKIKYGQYVFWSAQWLYHNEPSGSSAQPYIEDLAAFAADGENIPEDYAPYWAAQDDMVWTKANDFAYPLKTK